MYVCMYVCMYMCIYVWVYICMYVCMYVCMQVYMYASMYASMYVCKYVCVYASMYVCMYVCMYASMYVCMYVCIYVCMHACLYVCMYIFVYVCMYVCRYICLYVCMYLRMYVFFLTMIYCACSTTLGSICLIPNYVHWSPGCFISHTYWAFCCRTSKSIDSTNALNFFWYLNMRSCLLAGQVLICCCRTARWELVFALWNRRWSMVWYSWLQLHVASSIRWNLCRYAFAIPCPVSTAVIFGVSFILDLSLSRTEGK
jgi:hypothetical protein